MSIVKFVHTEYRVQYNLAYQFNSKYIIATVIAYSEKWLFSTVFEPCVELDSTQVQNTADNSAQMQANAQDSQEHSTKFY